MAELQRCVIRDELVEVAKLIQKRYCLRSWGDAVNMVFAAHRHAYMEEEVYRGDVRSAALPGYGSPQPPRYPEPSTLPAPSVSNGAAHEATKDEMGLRDYLSNLNFS